MILAIYDDTRAKNKRRLEVYYKKRSRLYDDELIKFIDQRNEGMIMGHLLRAKEWKVNFQIYLLNLEQLGEI